MEIIRNIRKPVSKYQNPSGSDSKFVKMLTPNNEDKSENMKARFAILILDLLTRQYKHDH